MALKRSPGRKLLVASLGVAAVSYTACGQTSSTGVSDAGKTADAGTHRDAQQVVGNLMAFPVDSGHDSGNDAQQIVGNLMAFPVDSGHDSGNDSGLDSGHDARQIVGNLMAFPTDGAADGKQG
jgi:hypothetical protein